MSTLTYYPTPMSSGEIQTIDPGRADDVQRKHEQISHFLQVERIDALLLQTSSSFSWFTAGGDSSPAGRTESAASLFITPEARVIVCNNVDSGQMFDRELHGLGFQLKERPWHEPRHVLIGDLCRGRRVASDTGVARTVDVSDVLRRMRVRLLPAECDRIRELGKLVTHAVEATARGLTPGVTEAEIAGEVSHRLIKHQVIPERLQVIADTKGQRYRHWGYSNDQVVRHCVISATGRQNGLCATVSRTVSFGELCPELKTAHQNASLMQATGMYFSKAGWQLFETWTRVARIYEKFGYPHEWELADQGEITGFDPCELPIVPQEDYRLAGETAVCWHPSVGPMMVGDTILIGDRGFEILTTSPNWPMFKVNVKGTSILRPDILSLPTAASTS